MTIESVTQLICPNTDSLNYKTEKNWLTEWMNEWMNVNANVNVNACMNEWNHCMLLGDVQLLFQMKSKLNQIPLVKQKYTLSILCFKYKLQNINFLNMYTDPFLVLFACTEVVHW